jgi:hypothetical protein
MSMGPIELFMVAFRGRPTGGRIVAELEALSSAGTIRVVDGVVVAKNESGELEAHDLDEPGVEPELAALRALITQPVDLVSSEDIEELAVELPPGAVAALLAVEHLWAVPLRTAVSDAGGDLLADVLVPGEVVDEVLAATTS